MSPERRVLLLDPGEAVVRGDIFDVARRTGLEPILATRRIAWERGRVTLWVETDPADPDGVLRALAERGLAIDAVFNCREPYVMAAAAIAERRGLPGLSSEVASRCRDKLLMRERLLPAGIPMARHHPITCIEDLSAASGVTGFPAVLKPSSGSGSKSTVRCETLADAIGWFAALAPELAASASPLFREMQGRWVMEEYLEGAGYSVESVTTDGAPVHVTACEKGPMEPPFFREVGHSIPPRLPRAAVDEMLDLTTRAIQALGIKHCVTHTEFKATAAGLRLLEVGPRIGGGSIRQVVHHATGIDLLEIGLRIAAGEAPNLAASLRQAAASRSLYPAAEGTLRRLAGLDKLRAMPGIVHVNEWMAPGQVYRLPPRAYGEVLGVVAVAPDAPSAIHRAQDALSAAEPEWESRP